MILPYSVSNPWSGTMFWSNELTDWYVDRPRSLQPVLRGTLSGHPPPVVTALVFYPFTHAHCAVERFLFTTSSGVAMAFNDTLPIVGRQFQWFELPVALPAEWFTITGLSNHGDSYTCIPPFELYGLSWASRVSDEL
jgi:hypothetical protein